MKRAIFLFIAFSISHGAFTQPMHVKGYNFTSFTQDKKMDVALLDKMSSGIAKVHPEYGITPYNAQCKECIELIDERTINSRQFINVHNAHRTYSQQSYFPLHYKKSENDIWHTIDFRLRPDANNPGIYTAPNQPVSTKCDLNRKLTSLNENGFEFECNKGLTMYFYDDNVAYTKAETGNYTRYTIGEEGLEVKNFWQGIDLQEIFSIGQVESNFVINAPLELPISKGWMVIEDHFSLPDGITIEESPTGKHLENGFYQGDYLIKDRNGKTLITYQKPKYTDAASFAMRGMYKLLKTGNDYTLQMMVPVDWLANKYNTYPITIDPVIFGQTMIGNFISSGQPTADLAYTSAALGSCNYNMTVVVPGPSQLTDVYADIEYKLMHDNACADSAHSCTFSEVTMKIENDLCSTTTGPLSCTMAYPPNSGDCTTDPRLDSLAHSIHINQIWPDFLACIAPQCQPFNLPFTLQNQDAVCGDVCGYLCALGTMWRMTVYACQVEGYITQADSLICAGQADTFTAHADCGVPPYHYAWTTDGGLTYDTIYNSAEFIVHPEQDMKVSCIIFDSCLVPYFTDTLNVTVLPTPTANAGSDKYLCGGVGGTVTIGGTPTASPAGATIQWTGENATVQSWLSNITISNPTVTIPQGTVDSFYYVVTVSNTSCFRTDTVWVYSLPNPQVSIDTSGSTMICANQSITLSANAGYTQYAWSNGSTDSAITVNQPGSYQVTVTDAHHCTGSSNSINILTIPVPSIHVYPDTTILFGDSVTLYTSLNLTSNSIDSFIWYPFINMMCNTCPNPEVSPANQQIYGVVAYTASGCIISDSALIQVIFPNDFYIPNAFNPDNPLKSNLTFYIYYQSGVTVLLFQVFDRWGEKVYEGNGLPSGTGWDGTYKGKPAPMGVYVYVAKLGLPDRQGTVIKKGSVTLIR